AWEKRKASDRCARKNLGYFPLLTQSFDELRPPANLALRVTFDVIYPSVPASPCVLQIRFCDLSVLDDCCDRHFVGMTGVGVVIPNWGRKIKFVSAGSRNRQASSLCSPAFDVAGGADELVLEIRLWLCLAARSRTRRGVSTRRRSRCAPWARGRATGTFPRGRPVRAHRRNTCGRQRRP